MRETVAAAKLSTTPMGRRRDLIFRGGTVSRREKSIREDSFVIEG
jgi:hypothetical protein